MLHTVHLMQDIGHTNINTLHNIYCNNSDAKDFDESPPEKRKKRKEKI